MSAFNDNAGGIYIKEIFNACQRYLKSKNGSCTQIELQRIAFELKSIPNTRFNTHLLSWCQMGYFTQDDDGNITQLEFKLLPINAKSKASTQQESEKVEKLDIPDLIKNRPKYKGDKPI